MANCAGCGQFVPPGNLRDYESLKEFRISGMCQECQDSMFGGAAEDEDAE